MKRPLLILFGFFTSHFLFSQILTVNLGSSVSIASGSSVTLDGLEIAPSKTYVISNNSVSRSPETIGSEANISASRVYSSLDLLSGFTGSLVFSYLDGELVGIVESDLVLQLQANDDSWTSYEGNVNMDNNTVSYTFSEAVSFKAVTASANGTSLAIEDINPTRSSIFVYPNPTADRIYIQAEKILQAELFDLLGRKVKATNQNQINLSNMASGTFILKVTTEKNKTQSFKIIKK